MANRVGDDHKDDRDRAGLLPQRLDVADEISCRNMVAATVATLGRFDILVNNAGIGGGKRPEEFALSEWNALLATNLTGVFLTAQAAYPERHRQLVGLVGRI